jgi:enoyl-CoA hydratase/carnithine racemase
VASAPLAAQLIKGGAGDGRRGNHRFGESDIPFRWRRSGQPQFAAGSQRHDGRFDRSLDGGDGHGACRPQVARDQGSSDENTPDRLREKMLPFYRAWLAPRYLPIPVIAAVNGPAVGAGLCLALACDLRYAATGATFSAPFLQLGTHGGMAASWLLPEAISLSRARELLYTGRVVQADEALRWGLVSGVAEDVVAMSVEVAAGIAGAAPIATRLTKAGLAQAAGGGFEAALQWEALAQPVTMSTTDIHEGIQARREHRAPNFEGN